MIQLKLMKQLKRISVNDEDAKNAMTVTRNKTHFILEFETTGAMEAISS